MATTMQLQQAQARVRWASGLDILAGIWLILAPYILGYDYSRATTNDIVVGIVVLVLAAVREVGDNYRVSWPSWINTLLGVWLILSPFILAYPSGSPATMNDIVLGIVVGVLSLIGALATPAATE